MQADELVHGAPDQNELLKQLVWPPSYQNPIPKKKYHLVVIGAGPAGLIASISAAGLGANVALVEKAHMGGDCLNNGCVPSKALLAYTQRNKDAAFEDAFSWMRKIRASIAHHDSVQRYVDAGVDVFLGEGSFKSNDELMVGDAILSSRRFAIATGARSKLPPIPGLQEANPLTPESFFALTECPDSIAILGGGAVGCELAQVMGRLGSKVHLFEAADTLLPAEEYFVSRTLQSSLEKEGVVVHTGDRVERIEDGRTIISRSGSYECHKILVALGRQPNTEGLGLSALGVKCDEVGHPLVDSKLRTTNKKIYAIGDCTGHYQFTHFADGQARALVQNALFANTAKISSEKTPRSTYTQPEVAAVGASTRMLDQQGEVYDTYEYFFDELDRVKVGKLSKGVHREEHGFVRVLVKRGGDQILGATIISPNAGDDIAPLVVMMTNNLGLGSLSSTIFSYPTRSEYLKKLSDAFRKTRLTPFVAGVFRRWLRLTAR